MTARELVGPILQALFVTGVCTYAGYVLGSWRRVEGATKGQEVQMPQNWHALPSGWSKTCGALSGYAIKQNGSYYWWVRRGDKTIIEGPARTLEMAKYEAEAAMHDFMHG